MRSFAVLIPCPAMTACFGVPVGDRSRPRRGRSRRFQFPVTLLNLRRMRNLAARRRLRRQEGDPEETAASARRAELWDGRGHYVWALRNNFAPRNDLEIILEYLEALRARDDERVVSGMVH